MRFQAEELARRGVAAGEFRADEHGRAGDGVEGPGGRSRRESSWIEDASRDKRCPVQADIVGGETNWAKQESEQCKTTKDMAGFFIGSIHRHR
jgi:hypothetical protein